MYNFDFAINLGIDAYSAALLIFLFVAAYRQTNEKMDHPRRRKLFLTFLALNLLVLVADLLGRMDGVSSTQFFACRAGNFILFLVDPILVLLWFLYVCEQIDVEEKTEKRGFLIQTLLCIINGVAVVSTPFTGSLYFFDALGVYHRGPFFWMTSTAMLCMVAYTELILLFRRKSVERKHLWALLFFPVIPIIASFVQFALGGIAFALNGTVYAILIVFVYVQSRSIDLDYLTGLYNRRKLDFYLQQKIASANGGKGFSAILIDIDQFKKINDRLGHQTGDAALVAAAGILRSSLRAGTFIARYGGDEFFVLLEMEAEKDLASVMDRVHRETALFNKRSGRAYHLTFSMGGAVYRISEHMSQAVFQQCIDDRMYEEKRAHAAAQDIPSAVKTIPTRCVSDSMSEE